MNRKSPDDQKRFKVDVRVTARELEILDLIARDLGQVSRGESIRRLIRGLRIRAIRGPTSRGRIVIGLP